MNFTHLAVADAVVLAPLPALSQTLALNMTRHQLDDAEVVDASGQEIGEIDRVLIAADGTDAGLVVEIDRPGAAPDKLVRIPLTGLKRVPQKGHPGEFDIQTQQTAAQLLALPDWTPPVR